MSVDIGWSRRAMGALSAIALTSMGSCTPPPNSGPSATSAPATAAPTQPVPDQPAAVMDSGFALPTLDGVTVAVIGDSLTLSAKDEIETAFDNADAAVVAFDALDGRRMVYGSSDRPGGLAAVTDTAVTPDVWVVALGTNDVAAQVQPDERAADIESILDAVDAPVAWIDVYVGGYRDESAAFGEQVREAAIQRSDLVVGDWFHQAADSDLLVDDQVHLTEAGKQRFAELMVDTVEDSQSRS